MGDGSQIRKWDITWRAGTNLSQESSLMSPEMRSVPSGQSGDPRSFSLFTISSSLQEQKTVVKNHCITANVDAGDKCVMMAYLYLYKTKSVISTFPPYILTLKEWCSTESLTHSPSSQDQMTLWNP